MYFVNQEGFGGIFFHLGCHPPGNLYAHGWGGLGGFLFKGTFREECLFA